MSKILFIGNIQLGEAPTGGGAQARNQLFLNQLNQFSTDVSYYDTWGKSRIISLLVIFFRILTSPQKRIILSLSFPGVFLLSKILSILRINRHITYWVIGGDLIYDVRKKGSSTASYLSYFKTIVVQAHYLATDLKKIGLKNVEVVPNFKKIDYFPSISRSGKKVRFIFLSRLIEDKGVGLILKAVERLDPDMFEVDFYGAPSTVYNEKFFRQLNTKNVTYKGFLDLSKKEGYDTLATYDVLLFPTFFKGEGFPGVVIDAFIAGLAVVTTDFHANPEIIMSGQNGIIIPPQDLSSLENAMNDIIETKYDLKQLKKEAQLSAKCYNLNNIINKKLLQDLGILH